MRTTWLDKLVPGSYRHIELYNSVQPYRIIIAFFSNFQQYFFVGDASLVGKITTKTSV